MSTATAPTRVSGLHHVTAIASDPQKNHDFYVKTLGLRMVKKTVNFDDPTTYHLYYGDELGRPGSAMTFFPWTRLRHGRVGLGQSAVTQFSAPAGSLDFWEARLSEAGAELDGRRGELGQTSLALRDPDGLRLALVEVADDPRAAWTGEGVEAKHALRGFHGVTLWLSEAGPTEAVLTELLGYRREQEAEIAGGKLIRLRAEGPAPVVDILETRALPHGSEGWGVTHHIAFSVRDDAAQAAMRKRLSGAGLGVTPVIDRDYFHSIYFRSPGGVLFEVATENPGFTRDEPAEALGTALKLPRQHEPYRKQIEDILPPIRTEG